MADVFSNADEANAVEQAFLGIQVELDTDLSGVDGDLDFVPLSAVLEDDEGEDDLEDDDEDDDDDSWLNLFG